MWVNIPDGEKVERVIRRLQGRLNRFIIAAEKMNQDSSLEAAIAEYSRRIGLDPHYIKAVLEKKEIPCAELLKSLDVQEWKPDEEIYVPVQRKD